MRNTLRLLKTHPLIDSHSIVDYKQGPDFYYIRADITLIDGSMVYLREYLSSSEHMYAYHWQTKEGDVIVRWDNARDRTSILESICTLRRDTRGGTPNPRVQRSASHTRLAGNRNQPFQTPASMVQEAELGFERVFSKG